MPAYIITIENDTLQQLVFHADSVSEALDKAKIAFKEEMVTGTEQNLHRTILQDHPSTVYNNHPKLVINAPIIKESTEEKKQRLWNEVPD